MGQKWNRDAAHKWLAQHYPKTGVCEECGWPEETQWAYLHHPAPYTLARGDYRELCRSCHAAFDRKIQDRSAPQGYVYARGR